MTDEQNRPNPKAIILNLLPFLVLVGFLAVMNSFVVLTEGDDLINLKTVSEDSLPYFLQDLYLTWSGRIVANTLIYLVLQQPINLFRTINTLMGLVLVLSLAVHLFDRKFFLRDDDRMRVVLWFLCLGYGFIDETVMISSMFWVTGSLSYLWIVAAASVALIPFSDRYAHHTEGLPGGPVWLQPVYWVAAVVAGNGLEQTALLIVGLSFLTILVIYLRTRKVDRYLIFLFAIMLASAVVMFVAPGNRLRFVTEVDRWFPDFQKMSIKLHLFIGLQWIMEKLSEVHRIFMALFYGLLVVHLSTRSADESSRRQRFLNGFAWWGFSLSLPLALNLVYADNRVWEILSKFLAPDDFLALLGQPDYWLLLRALVPYFLWIPIVVMLPVLIWNARLDMPLDRRSLTIILLAGLATAGIMILSPTIYASGNRTWLPFNAVVLLVLTALLYPIADRIPKPVLIVLFAVPVLQLMTIISSA